MRKQMKKWVLFPSVLLLVCGTIAYSQEEVERAKAPFKPVEPPRLFVAPTADIIPSLDLSIAGAGTTIIVDKYIRKDAIVIAELKGVTVFAVKINGKETNLKAIEVLTDKGDKLFILDELQNPLVLSAEVAGRYKSKVTAIYIPGYVQPPASSWHVPRESDSP